MQLHTKHNTQGTLIVCWELLYTRQGRAIGYTVYACWEFTSRGNVYERKVYGHKDKRTGQVTPLAKKYAYKTAARLKRRYRLKYMPVVSCQDLKLLGGY